MHPSAPAFALFLSTFLCAAAPAPAQSTLSLSPSSFHTTPAVPISLRLLESPQASTTAQPTDLHWFFIRCAGTKKTAPPTTPPRP